MALQNNPSHAKSIATIIAKTDEYLRIPAVVGHEKPFLDYLQADYAKLGYHVQRAENIVAVSGEQPDSCILTAHSDRHGILSIGDGDYRYAAHVVKDIKYNEKTSASDFTYLKHICHQFTTENVFAYDNNTGSTAETGTVEACYYCTDRANLVFKVADMPPMARGTPLAYAHNQVEQGDYIVGQLDNTLCVAIIYALFQRGFQGTVIFTAEEEIGKSWQHLGHFLATQQMETEQLLVLDTSPYTTTEFADAGKIVLRRRDGFSMFNADMTQTLQNMCNNLNLPYDIKDKTLLEMGKETSELGRTELGRLLHEYDGRWQGTTLQIPTFNYHTNNESTTRRAICNFFTLLREYCVRT